MLLVLLKQLLLGSHATPVSESWDRTGVLDTRGNLSCFTISFLERGQASTKKRAVMRRVSAADLSGTLRYPAIARAHAVVFSTGMFGLPGGFYRFNLEQIDLVDLRNFARS